MHIIRPLHPQTLNHWWKTVQVFIEKNPCISKPMPFKPTLFKSQLYIHIHTNMCAQIHMYVNTHTKKIICDSQHLIYTNIFYLKLTS